MKCTILHESAGRLRVHLCCARMTLHQADVLEYYLRDLDYEALYRWNLEADE